jgi:hypothetical protein
MESIPMIQNEMIASCLVRLHLGITGSPRGCRDIGCVASCTVSQSWSLFGQIIFAELLDEVVLYELLEELLLFQGESL